MPYIRDMPPIDERDYEAPDTMIVSDPKQLRAMADPFRVQLVQLMRDQARSTQQLSEELSVPKGTVGHHLKVLESAGLIRVVRTRKVRAMTEKFYGRSARLFLYQTDDPDSNRTIGSNTMRQATSEVESAAYVTGFGLVRARLTKKDMHRLHRRAQKLLDDFRAADTPGERPWSLTLGFWSTEQGDDDA
jgi:DNA-binding transcriptional ArsR family regulator